MEVLGMILAGLIWSLVFYLCLVWGLRAARWWRRRNSGGTLIVPSRPKRKR